MMMMQDVDNQTFDQSMSYMEALNKRMMFKKS